MVQIVSKRLGTVELDDAAVLHFPAGLPGFEHCTRFALVERAATVPIVFLQSLDLQQICFLAVSIKAIDSGYQLAMTREDLERIGIDSTEDVICLAILSPAEDGRFTANLLAPVVIDRKTRRAVQAVRVDSRYSHQHPLTGGEAPCS